MKENHIKTIDKETTIYYYILKRQYYERYLNTLHEEQTQYEIINNEHDKTYRNVLSDLDEAVEIINEALKLKGNNKIKEEEIERYNNSFITNQYKNRQADIVYKLKTNNTFFLIEHQSKQDYSMPFRLQEYKLEIAKSAINIKKLKTKGYDIPVVIPIVVYTGSNQWKASLNLEQIKDERLKNIDLGKYNVVDMNKYTKEELLNNKHLIYKVFLMEKEKDKTKIIETLKKAMTTLEKSKKQKLVDILIATQRGKIDKDEIKKLTEGMQGGEEHMIRALDIIREDGIKIGRKEGIRIILTNMSKKGLKIEEIMEITGLSKKEIEQVQN